MEEKTTTTRVLKKHQNVFAKCMVVIIFAVISSVFGGCANRAKQWITTDNGVKIWIRPENGVQYQWDGSMFDGLANGQGVLTKVKKGKVLSHDTLTAVMGAVNKGDVEADSTMKYIGAYRRNKPQGFGVNFNDTIAYIGTFENGQINGPVRIYLNGAIYFAGEYNAQTNCFRIL